MSALDKPGGERKPRGYDPKYDEPEDRPFNPPVSPGKRSRTQARYGLLQRSAAASGEVVPDPDRIDAAARTSGAALPARLQAELEQSIGADLSGVRVHTDEASGAAAQSVRAKAFATGSDIFFAPGNYDPDSDAGRHLIAHEVAHTVQQAGASGAVQAKPEVSKPSDAAEVEADGFAAGFVRGEQTPVVQRVAAAMVAREEEPGSAASPKAVAGEDQAQVDPLDFERNLRLAGQLMAKLSGTFAPQHVAARDALRADRARSNGHKAAASVLRIHAHLDAAKASIATSSETAAPRGSWQSSPADGKLVRVAEVEAKLTAFATDVAPFMGMQSFRHKPVPGNHTVSTGDLARAIDATSELAYRPMIAAMQLRDLAQVGQAEQSAAAVVKQFGLDDAQKRFLFAILEAEGVFDKVKSSATLENGPGTQARSHTLADVRTEATKTAEGGPTIGDGAVEYHELKAEIEARLGRLLNAHERAKLQELAARRASELGRLAKQQRDLATIEADLAELRQKQHMFRLYDAGTLQPPKKSFAQELWHEATGGDSGRRGFTGAYRTVKGAIVDTVEESGRLREQAIERGDYVGAAFTPVSTIVIGSGETVADGLALAEKAIHERLEAKTFKEKLIADLRVLLGFGEAVAGAWGMVAPLAPKRGGGIRPSIRGGAVTVGAGGGGSVAAAAGDAVASGALSRPAIMMAVAGLEPLGEGPEVNAMHDEPALANEKRMPKEGDDKGFWEGQRGNSDFRSDNPDVNTITKGEPIPFRDGYPDFSKWERKADRVYLLGGKIDGTAADFTAADRVLAKRRGWLKPNGEPNAAAAKAFRRRNRLTWHHHQDGEMLQLVPTDLHRRVPHVGGASAARSAEL